LYAHIRIAEALGCSAEQARDASEGRLPGNLSERESTIYQIARILIQAQGRLEDVAFDEACRIIGKDALSVVIQVVGWYAYNSIMVNAAGIRSPEEK
jgi:hypothetical protein